MPGRYRNSNYMKEWREKNKEKVAAQQRNYKKRNKKTIDRYKKRYRKKNAMSISEYNKRYGKGMRRGDANRIKDYKLRQDYGIGFKDYAALLEKQNGLCAICKKAETSLHNRTGKVKALAVDHDHVSGKIRGLLCNKCNRAIGMFGDSTVLMKSAVKYLEGA